eukprot:359937-Chlamydomonas_euryale.AAC.14
MARPPTDEAFLPVHLRAAMAMCKLEGTPCHRGRTEAYHESSVAYMPCKVHRSGARQANEDAQGTPDRAGMPFACCTCSGRSNLEETGPSLSQPTRCAG